MASATKDRDEKGMASDPVAPGADEPRDEKPSQQPPPQARGDGGGGFFHIYKKGQGYWTRMGTAAGALLIAGLTTQFLWLQTPVLANSFGATPDAARSITIGVCAAFLIGFALLTFWLMNKPANADFLIA